MDIIQGIVTAAGLVIFIAVVLIFLNDLGQYSTPGTPAHNVTVKGSQTLEIFGFYLDQADQIDLTVSIVILIIAFLAWVLWPRGDR